MSPEDTSGAHMDSSARPSILLILQKTVEDEAAETICGYFELLRLHFSDWEKIFEITRPYITRLAAAEQLLASQRLKTEIITHLDDEDIERIHARLPADFGAS